MQRIVYQQIPDEEAEGIVLYSLREAYSRLMAPQQVISVSAKTLAVFIKDLYLCQTSTQEVADILRKLAEKGKLILRSENGKLDDDHKLLVFSNDNPQLCEQKDS